MTRLTNQDIEEITERLAAYDERLKRVTGYGIIEIACHCYGASVEQFKQQAKSFSVAVVPVTAGLGVISSFSETVAAILRFLGIHTQVTPSTDVAGLASAIENGVNGIFMADDSRFIGLDYVNKRVIDNGHATGQIYAAALDLMAGGLSGKSVLVIGCGAVGGSAAEHLLLYGVNLTLFDIDVAKALRVKEELVAKFSLSDNEVGRISICTNLEETITLHDHILDATPARSVLPDELLTDSKKIAIPGVPPGVSEYGFDTCGGQIVHDKLELGVAAMIGGLLLTGKRLDDCTNNVRVKT